MAGDALLIILVTVAMLVFDGMSVLLLYASFLPFMCAYLLVVKKRVRKYGEDDMLAKRKQSRTVMDTFGGIHGIGGEQCFSYFSDRFS